MRYRYELTTVDNPFDPFEQPESWFEWDRLNGYNTPSLVARFAKTSDELTDELNQEELNRAYLRIMALDPFNIYKRVRKPITSMVEKSK